MLTGIIISALLGGVLIWGLSGIIEWLVVKRVMDNPLHGGVIALIATWALLELTWVQFDGERIGLLPYGLDGLVIALLISIPALRRRHRHASDARAEIAQTFD